MPSRASLDLQARSLGINPANYVNDSRLEQRIIWQQEQASTVAGSLSTGTLTSTAQPANGDTVTIGSRTYEYVTTLPEAPATVTVTDGNTQNFSNGDTITINTTTYTFVTTLGAVVNQIAIGGTADLSLQNLIYAILGTGTAGTNYSNGTVANPQVTAGTLTAHAVTLSAKTNGSAGNSYTITANPAIAASVTLSANQFSGGVDPITNALNVSATGTITSNGTLQTTGDTVTVAGVTYRLVTTLVQANDVLIQTSAAVTLANLVQAINGTGTFGTNVGYGTNTNPLVSASSSTNTMTLTARTSGTVGNSYAISTVNTGPTMTASGATLSGGAATTTYQVLIGGSQAAAMTNLGYALGKVGGTPGVQFASNVPVNPDISVGTVTGTTVPVTAAFASVNNLSTTKSSANFSWGGATLTGGTPSTLAPTSLASDVQAMAGGAPV